MKYCDLRNKKETTVERVFSEAVGYPCKRAEIKLNEGYDPSLEDKIYIPDLEGFQASIERLQAEKTIRQNNLLFEDDVISYLLGTFKSVITPIRSQQLIENFCDSDTEIFSLANESGSNTLKIIIYAENTQFRFILSSLGNSNKDLQEKSKTYYGFAANLQQRLKGRKNSLGLIYEKMSNRFERYLALASEIFQETLYNMKDPIEFGLSKELTINELLDRLNKAEEGEKEAILKRLKDLTQ